MYVCAWYCDMHVCMCMVINVEFMLSGGVSICTDVASQRRLPERITHQCVYHQSELKGGVTHTTGNQPQRQTTNN